MITNRIKHNIILQTVTLCLELHLFLLMSVYEKSVGDTMFSPIPSSGSGIPHIRISTQLAHASDYIWLEYNHRVTLSASSSDMFQIFQIWA